MKTVPKPTTYLTIEELQQVAAAKFEEAAALPAGPRKQQILNSAYSWLSSELKPPK
jgi:hypothetical protein